MQWLRLHIHPKLHAHKWGAHIMCLNTSYAVDGHMEPSATRYHRPCWPRFWQSSAENLDHTAGLQTIPLCSGWGSIPIQSCMHINEEHI
jgi:hypothetical protein